MDIINFARNFLPANPPMLFEADAIEAIDHWSGEGYPMDRDGHFLDTEDLCLLTSEGDGYPCPDLGSLATHSTRMTDPFSAFKSSVRSFGARDCKIHMDWAWKGDRIVLHGMVEIGSGFFIDGDVFYQVVPREDAAEQAAIFIESARKEYGLPRPEGGDGGDDYIENIRYATRRH